MHRFRKIGSVGLAVALCIGTLFGGVIPGQAFDLKGEKILSKAAVFSKNGMVACSNTMASRVGVKVLEDGGNAFDAAIATALTLNAVEPSMCGIGGASFWVIWNAKEKKLYALDADTQAPAAATPDKFADRKELLSGLKAMGIPGTAAAYFAVLQKFGTMPFEKVMQPSLRYLEEGFVLTQRGKFNFDIFAAQAPLMYPNLAKVYAPDGAWPPAGSLMKNPDLARTLRTLAKEGPDAFYKGSIAKAMVDYHKANGGLWTMEDLANYKLQWLEPVHMTYKGLDVYGAQPPSAAITWMEMLKIAEGYDFSKIADNSVEYVHLMTEISRLANADSMEFVTDPKTMTVPVKELLSDNYAAAQRKRINLAKAAAGKVMPGNPVEWSKKAPATSQLPVPLEAEPISVAESIENMTYRGATNHVVIVDKDGNCVSFTHTLGQFFGGQDILGDTGVIGNNGMDWFDLDKNPWTEKPSNLKVAPNKRNRWTLSPGMIFKDGKPYVLIGGAGAETTMSGIFQVLVRMLEYKLNPQAAISSPRFLYGDVYHYTAGTRLNVEPEVRPFVEKALTAMGHDVVKGEELWRMMSGHVWSILIDPKTGSYAGGAEIRGDGHVDGY
jgi:gamma-glutamyltranspeptidase